MKKIQYILELRFLSHVAKISPSFARGLEIAIYEIFFYSLGVISAWSQGEYWDFDYKHIIYILIIPCVAAIQKRSLDIRKHDSKK